MSQSVFLASLELGVELPHLAESRRTASQHSDSRTAGLNLQPRALGGSKKWSHLRALKFTPLDSGIGGLHFLDSPRALEVVLPAGFC